jgi:hypothetical protein
MTRARLTRQQKHRYEQLFAIAADELDGSNFAETEVSERADEEAWRGLIEEWPELAIYTGADD